MWASVVVAVSAILLLLFHLFSLIFYCETMARDSFATLWKKRLLQNNFNAHVRPAHTKYAWLQKSGGARTVRTYCSVDEICVTHTVRCSSCTRKKRIILWTLPWPDHLEFIAGSDVSIVVKHDHLFWVNMTGSLINLLAVPEQIVLAEGRISSRYIRVLPSNRLETPMLAIVVVY